MKFFVFNTLIIAVGLFASDLLLDSVHIPNIPVLFMVAALFTGIVFFISDFIKSSTALFIINMFIFYLLSLFLPTFEVKGFFAFFLLTFIVSIAEAVLTSEE